MAITKVINDAVDLNQTSDYSGLRLPVGTTGNVVESFTTDYLVVGGGGGTGTDSPGGGGGGGLRTSYNNSTTTTNTLSFPSGKTAIATYMLDNNATDISGNHNGTETNITYNTGKYGGGAVFNGSNSSIFISSTGTSVTDYDQDFSISFWFNFISLNASYSYNVLFTGGGTKNIQFLIDTTNGARFQLYNGTIYYVDTGAVSAGNWYHVVATRSKTNGLEIYLNGISKDTNSFTGNSSAISNKDSIGSYWDGTRNSFNGSIDQVRIYDTALSGTDVTNIYNNEVQALSGGGIAAESSLTLTEGVAYDVTVGNGGTKAAGSNSVFSNIISDGGGAGGGSGSSAGYNGGNGGSGGGASGGNYSLPGGNGTTAQGYAGGGSGSQAGAGYPGGGGGGASAKGQTLATSSDNGGTGGDGVITNILNSTNATSARVGEVSGSNVYYSGGGGGSTYTTTLGTGGLGGGADGQKYIDAQTTNDGTTNTGGGGGAQNSTGGSGVVILRYPTAGVASFTVTGTLNTPSTTDTLADNNYPVTNVAYYKLDGDAADSSGNGYNGAGSNVTWINGRFSQAAAFYGSTSSYISLPTGSPFDDSDTIKCISAWIKPNISTSRVNIFSISSTTDSKDYFVLNFDNGNSRIQLRAQNGSSSNRADREVSITPTTNWVHVVAQVTASTTEIYLNGVQQTIAFTNNGSATDTSWISYPSYSTAAEGRLGLYRISSPLASDGSIDQVRIFGSALSASNITDLYNEHYQTKFTDGSDTAILFTEGTGTLTFSGVNPAPPQGALRTNTSYSEDGSGSAIEHYNGTEWKYFDAIKYCTTNTLNFPPGAGCIASYNLNNNVDDIGNTYNGVNSAVTFNASGKFGAAAVFNGSSSKIEINSPIVNVSNDYTVSMWVNASDVTTFTTIYENINTDGYLANQALITILNGTIRMYVAPTSGSSTIYSYNFSGASLSVNTWYHLVFVVKTNSNHIAYIDGTPYSSTYLSSTTSTPSGFTTIGYGNTNYFDGSIDQVRIFNSALSSTQVGELYNNEIACS